jgi:hypothetical protein
MDYLARYTRTNLPDGVRESFNDQAHNHAPPTTGGLMPWVKMQVQGLVEANLPPAKIRDHLILNHPTEYPPNKRSIPTRKQIQYLRKKVHNLAHHYSTHTPSHSPSSLTSIERAEPTKCRCTAGYHHQTSE